MDRIRVWEAGKRKEKEVYAIGRSLYLEEDPGKEYVAVIQVKPEDLENMEKKKKYYNLRKKNLIISHNWCYYREKFKGAHKLE